MSIISEEKQPINLHWGKPAPALLPAQKLAVAAQTVFSDPSISVAGLRYRDSTGYQPLRERLSLWLSDYYGSIDNPDQICITDPLATKAVWMVAPCFYMACRIFEDAGLTGKLKGVDEDDEGIIDLDFLEREMAIVDNQESTKLVSPLLLKKT